MLKIIEINSDEQFDTTKAKENNNFDYLYILKHKKEIVLSDNGEIIQLCSTKQTDYTSELIANKTSNAKHFYSTKLTKIGKMCILNCNITWNENLSGTFVLSTLPDNCVPISDSPMNIITNNGYIGYVYADSESNGKDLGVRLLTSGNDVDGCRCSMCWLTNVDG